MNSHCCCTPAAPVSPTGVTGGATGRVKRGVKRVLGFLEWFLPSAVLALLPKCPMCLAAWLGVATGLGVSVSAAAQLRTGLVIACVAALVLFGARRITRKLLS